MSLLLNVVATVDVQPQPIRGSGLFFTGAAEQIREDIARAHGLGTTELIFELDLAPGIDELLATMDRLRGLAD